MITFDITESPGTEITIRQRNIEARASQELAPGCSRKRSQIEDELDDEDDSFGILTDVVENSWIDDPENYDLVDVFERNQRGRRSRDDFDDWFDP